MIRLILCTICPLILSVQSQVRAQAAPGAQLSFLVGAGLAWQFDGNGQAWRGTLHAALGARAALADRWGFRAEVRARAVDPFAGHMVDLVVGFTRVVF